MAYTPQTYGQPYGQMYNYGMTQATQPQYQQQQTQQQPSGMIWVDGEIGAKAYQIPAGWTPNTPLPLWDTNDTVIYLKSINQMGIPNPLQKIHYTMGNQQSQTANLMSGNHSGDSEPVDPSPRGMEAFATKKDLEKIRQEILQSISEINQPATTKKGARTSEPSV